MRVDSDGRAESAALPREVSLIYATESMRLTTRLMQIASWLLMQRAVNEGEMSPEQARTEKNKVRLDFQPPVMSGPLWSELPATLRSIIERTDRLHGRIVHMDKAIYATAAEPIANLVARDLDRLANALGARRVDN